MVTLNKITISFILVLFYLLTSCNINYNSKTDVQSTIASGNSYAKKFQIEKFDKYNIIRIFNPWQKADNVMFEYHLSKQKTLIPDSIFDENKFIQTPVKSVICLSTTHIGFIDALNELNSIKGIANGNLVNNARIIEGLRNQSIIDIGNDRDLNYEQMVKIKPDIIFTYGVGTESLEYIQKLNELGLKVMIIGEYLEDNPLAKTEWLKVFSSLYNKEQIADIILRNLSKNYNDLKKLAKSVTKQPLVITGLPWKGVWYVPGGNSYLAQLIEDAGGKYIWYDNTSAESLPLDFEVVFQNAQNADIWIHPGAANNLRDIVSVDERISDFNIYTKGNIFNNNLRQNIVGGNDYWESGLVHPDIIIRDLMKIFHPGLFPGYELVYYKKIK